jgi:hypothetical protein
MRYVIALLFLARPLLAVDWLCTEESSQRRGDAIYACGIGAGKTESAARAAAFASAKAEFDRVCSSSDDCRGHKVSAEPRRTECREEQGFKCYRLVAYTIAPSAHELEARAQATGVFITEGMPRRELVAFMGMPDIVAESYSPGRDLFLYKDNPKCNVHECLVWIDNHRKRVTTWSGVKPAFTDAVR